MASLCCLVLIGCASTVFGCCPDGQTVATDWSYVNCPGRLMIMIMMMMMSLPA